MINLIKACFGQPSPFRSEAVVTYPERTISERITLLYEKLFGPKTQIDALNKDVIHKISAELSDDSRQAFALALPNRSTEIQGGGAFKMQERVRAVLSNNPELPPKFKARLGEFLILLGNYQENGLEPEEKEILSKEADWFRVLERSDHREAKSRIARAWKNPEGVLEEIELARWIGYPFQSDPEFLAYPFSNQQVLEALLDAGVNPNQLNDSWKQRLLSNMLKLEPLGPLSCLMKAGMDLSVNAVYQTEPSLVNAALCRPDATEALKLMIKNGLDINRIGRRETHPLITAIVNNKLELAHFLFEQGAVVNWEQHASQLEASISHYDDSISELLLRLDTEPNFPLRTLLLKNAIKNRDQKMFSSLFDRSVPPPSSLTFSAIQHDMSCWFLNELLDAGARPDALHIAIEHHNHKAFDLLIEKGADPKKGLGLAIRSGNHMAFDKLIKHKADVNDPSDYPIFAAIYKKDNNLLKKLIVLGANVFVRDNDPLRWNAYHAAVMAGNTEAMEILSKEGCSTASYDYCNSTAYAYKDWV